MDLRELEPFDERGVVLRMGGDANALFYGSNSQQTSVPWMSRHAFNHWRDTSRNCPKKVPQWRAVLRRNVKLRVVQGLGDERVETPQRNGDIAQLVVRSLVTETRLIVTCCHQFVVGDRTRHLFQLHIPLSLSLLLFLLSCL